MVVTGAEDSHTSTSGANIKDSKETIESKPLIPVEVKAQSVETTKCAKCNGANFLASLLIIVFVPYAFIPLIYLILGLRSDLFVTYGMYISMCIYEAWIIVESVLMQPKIMDQLEKRRIIGLGLVFIIFLVCLVGAFLLSFIEGGAITLFIGIGNHTYTLLAWKCVAFFFVTTCHRYIFRNYLVVKGMCPVRSILCQYMISWILWALFSGQIAKNVMVSGVNDSWGTWGAFMQSMINGCLFGGHAMWNLIKDESTINKAGLAVIIGMGCTLFQMTVGYGVIMLLANITTELYGTAISQEDIMRGVFMFALTGTLVLTHISPFYKGLYTRYHVAAYAFFHTFIYFALSVIYYIFFCLAVCPLMVILLGENYLPVDSIFPIIIFPLIAIIGIARVSRYYSAPCGRKPSGETA